MQRKNWERLLRGLCAFSYLTTLLMISCCVQRPASAADAVRTGLDVVADVVGPTSELGATACDAREELVMGEVRAGRKTAAEGEHDLVPIRQKCTALRDRINQIRALHTEAVDLVERGGIEQAKARLEQARALLKALTQEGAVDG